MILEMWRTPVMKVMGVLFLLAQITVIAYNCRYEAY